MFSRLRRIWLCGFSILCCGGASVAADLESARRAYARQDYATAVKEFRALAEQGNREAELALGKMYMSGQGVSRDSDQAITWLKRAAVQDDSDAEFFLGSLYLLPQRDIGEGLKWLRLSAEQGNQDAQLLLGKAYIQGAKELPRDPVQGGMWLQLAAKDNKQFYQDELRAAERQLTPEQAAKAKTLADEWKPSPSSGAARKPQP